MPDAWKIHNAGTFTCELPQGWSVAASRTGKYIISNAQREQVLTLIAISPGSSMTPASTAPDKGVLTELQAWLAELPNAQPRKIPALVPEMQHPAAFASAAEVIASTNITSAGKPLPLRDQKTPWYKRLIGRDNGPHWHLWIIAGPAIHLRVSVRGNLPALHAAAPTVQRILKSLHITDRPLLFGHHFVTAVITTAQKLYPHLHIQAIDDAHVQLATRVLPLIDLHQQYISAPDELDGHVKLFFAAIHGALAASELVPIWIRARKSVLPSLMTRAALDSAPANLLNDSWINGLSVSYVLDVDGTDYPITAADVIKWQIDQEKLHNQAIQNLIVHSHEQTMDGHKADGYTMLLLATPDKHNAARILLPELHRKLRQHLGQTFYAAIPTHEFLLAFSTERDEVLTRVRQQITADYSKSKDGLSNKLFLVTPDGIAGDPSEEENVTL